jgi:hypothetical protein
MKEAATDTTSRYVRIDDTFEMNVDGHVVIVDRATEQMITVNEVAGVIWAGLATRCTLDEIVGHCCSAYPDADRATVAGDVEEFLTAAAAVGLVQVEV